MLSDKKKCTKKIGYHHDSRFPKTNYLKTNLLKQIKKYPYRITPTLYWCKDNKFIITVKVFSRKNAFFLKIYKKGIGS